MIRILISAIDKNRGMGLSSSISGLPWHIKEEIDYFKNITKGNGIEGKYALVMGRKTYEKILSMKNKVDKINLDDVEPLKMHGRETFLLSSKDFKNHNCVKKIEDIKGFDALFICGGVKVYESSLQKKLVDFVLLSKIKAEYESDAFMPEFEGKMKELKSFDKGLFTVHAYQANENTVMCFFEKLLLTI